MLIDLDLALAAAEVASNEDRLVLLCFLAGRDVALESHELGAALRRSELLLAAGGDPRRPLELHGRSVTALAEDLDQTERRAHIAGGLESLVPLAEHLPGTTRALVQLIGESDLAWQCYAMARLAEHLADDE
jgi:hypothetical protein